MIDFTWLRPDQDSCPLSAGRDAPQTACRETRQPPEESPRGLGSVPAF